MEKCYLCEKGNLTKKKVDFKMYGKSLGKFDAEVCNKCNEIFFNEASSDKIERIEMRNFAKEKMRRGKPSRRALAFRLFQ